MNRICVFCGSALGVRAEYGAQARALGQAMAGRGIGLVYGGGGIGMMGAVADGVLESRGEVIGVIPFALSGKERAHARAELRVVNTMHERKAMMAELADGFIVLPGGFGTFDEMFEILTWAQLGIHRKPVGLLNIAGYFDPLLAMIDRAIAEGFIVPRYRELIVVEIEAEPLLDRMETHRSPESIVQWMELNQT
jgi:uncharacterized protein (TIGR00730 family)